MCDHTRIFYVSAKASDCFYCLFPSGNRIFGYMPDIGGLGGGDYIKISICLDCSTVIGFNPSDVEQLDQEQEY